ncbi:MAG: 50S ribosomal protein L35 [Minisyncoccia bacterium]
MKTKKAYKKRLKLTRNGKLVSRKTGQNHFNAKESRRSQLNKKRSSSFHLTNKAASKFLVNM